MRRRAQRHAEAVEELGRGAWAQGPVIGKRHGRYPVGSEIPLRLDPERSDVVHVRDREMPMAVIAVIVAAAFLLVLGIVVRIAFFGVSAAP